LWKGNQSVRWDILARKLVLGSGLLTLLERREARRQNVLRILAYHRVDTPESETGRLDPTLLSATPGQFRHQMRFLAQHYRVLALDELLSALGSGRALPPRSVLVTFDDGYRDFLTNAWPVLQRWQIPTILFVATGYLAGDGQSFWWDQLHHAISVTARQQLRHPELGGWPLMSARQKAQAFEGVKQLTKALENQRALALIDEIRERLEVSLNGTEDLLTWQEVRRLSADGLSVCAHSRSHANLSRVTTQQARQEIVGAQQDLRRELGWTWPVFAYPYGRPCDLSSQLLEILRDAGFKAAMTTIPGHNLLGRTDPLRLRRVGLVPHLSLEEFRLALTQAFDIYGAILGPRRARTWG
jgi:peptidoglycan/xylan/chitin deacetylase (PgdA/CDA1 family)